MTAVRHADHSHMQCRAQIMKYYEDFRLRKIGTGTWLAETGKLVERMVTMDERDASARLFQAQLLITEERYNEAGWILDHAADMLEEPPSQIRQIYDAIGQCAPDYNVEKIYKRLSDQTV